MKKIETKEVGYRHTARWFQDVQRLLGYTNEHIFNDLEIGSTQWQKIKRGDWTV